MSRYNHNDDDEYGKGGRRPMKNKKKVRKKPRNIWQFQQNEGKA